MDRVWFLKSHTVSIDDSIHDTNAVSRHPNDALNKGLTVIRRVLKNNHVSTLRCSARNHSRENPVTNQKRVLHRARSIHEWLEEEERKSDHQRDSHPRPCAA